MSEELTPWFPAAVKPARIGVYQVAPFAKDEPRWSYWDGMNWSFFTIRLESLEEKKDYCVHSERMPWRGLAYDPAASLPLTN